MEKKRKHTYNGGVAVDPGERHGGIFEPMEYLQTSLPPSEIERGYFAPRPVRSTLTVSKMIAKSSSIDMCLI
jgi:hypothetical protein